MYTVLMLIFALLLVGLNGFFVAAEFAFVKVRRTQLELLASRGDRRAVSALFGVTHLDAYLSVCQLGITLASLGLGWIGEPAVSRALKPLLKALSITSPTLISSLSIAIGFAVITLLHVVFGELVPKSISIQKAKVTALLLARPMRLVYWLCLPLVMVMNGISNAFLRLTGVLEGSEGEQPYSSEELRILIYNASQGGRMDKEEGRMLGNIFRFYKKTAKDIMVHRTDAIALDADNSREQAVSVARKSGHTRFPVYEEDRNNIIGFVHIKDLLHCEDCVDLHDLIRTPAYAPEALRLPRLLRRMQNQRQQFCVVIDEYGIWQGILSMEDIVEDIVGDIQDEFDHEMPEIVAEADGRYVVSASLSLDDLSEHIPLECRGMGADIYKILAAHFIERLGRIPDQGDFIDLCGKRFTVAQMERNKIRRVQVEEIPDEQFGEISAVK